MVIYIKLLYKQLKCEIVLMIGRYPPITLPVRGTPVIRPAMLIGR